MIFHDNWLIWLNHFTGASMNGSLGNFLSTPGPGQLNFGSLSSSVNLPSGGNLLGASSSSSGGGMSLGPVLHPTRRHSQQNRDLGQPSEDVTSMTTAFGLRPIAPKTKRSEFKCRNCVFHDEKSVLSLKFSLKILRIWPSISTCG